MLIIIFMKVFYKQNAKNEVQSKLVSNLYDVLGGNLPIIVCIGTDAVIGDSLGPLVGSMLKGLLKGKTYIFGTVESPITAKEVGYVAEFVKNAYPNTPILAIDAALGKKEEIGSIKITKTPIKPGLGVDKDLAEIGTASIIGVVEEREKGKRLLSLVRLSLVYEQAMTISSAIHEYITTCNEKEQTSFKKAR